MTIEQSKEKLKKDGYTWFELSEFDPEFYNWLLPFKCNDVDNIKDSITGLRVDMINTTTDEKIQYREEFETHSDASQKGKEILNLIDNKEFKSSQIWYYTDFKSIVNDPINLSTFENYVKNIMISLYDFDETQEYSLFAPSFTYYDIGCHLGNHSDGTGTGRVCAFLLYLNETYDEKDGGYLVLNNKDKVIPTFGKVAIIDLQTFDIPHMVTKVTNGIGRYAILSFIKKKENEFVDY